MQLYGFYTHFTIIHFALQKIYNNLFDFLETVKREEQKRKKKKLFLLFNEDGKCHRAFKLKINRVIMYGKKMAMTLFRNGFTEESFREPHE
jgi:hypothetical protein